MKTLEDLGISTAPWKIYEPMCSMECHRQVPWEVRCWARLEMAKWARPAGQAART